jgi:hypothetical protein
VFAEFTGAGLHVGSLEMFASEQGILGFWIPKSKNPLFTVKDSTMTEILIACDGKKSMFLSGLPRFRTLFKKNEKIKQDFEK